MCTAFMIDTTMTTNNDPRPKPSPAATLNTLRSIPSYYSDLFYPKAIFNEELLANTRLSRRPAAGVLMHIEDGPEGVQRSSRRKKPLKNYLSTLKGVQNEPNLNNSKIAINTYYKKTYPSQDTWYRGKNEPKTNPFQSRHKPNFKITYLQESSRPCARSTLQINPCTEHDPNVKYPPKTKRQNIIKNS